MGKSTLFNKIIGSKQALTSEIGGTTRDTNIGKTEWGGVEFSLYDTAGLGLKPKDLIEKKVKEQSERKIKDAQVILFVLDGQEEILPQDKKIAKILRDLRKPVILVVNKMDSLKLRKKLDIFEFKKLGFEDYEMISASSGSGVGDLLDKVTASLKDKETAEQKNKRETANEEENKLPEIKIALVGKPNAGKSSLLNALIRRKVYIKDQEEIIVTDIPHTTREPQEREINTGLHKIKFIDTAGIRRKSKIEKSGLEILSVRKSIDTLKQADIILFIMDLSEPMTSQNKKLSGLIEENHNGLIIIGNKWDLIQEKTPSSDQDFKKYILGEMAHLRWAPIIFTSATEGKNILKIIEAIEQVYEERGKRISDDELKKFIGDIIKIKRPIRAKGDKNPKVYGFAQVSSAPPRFAITIGQKETLHFSYLRFIENRLREKYGFIGTSIQILIKYKK